MVYPRIVSTDLNDLRLLAGFGEEGCRGPANVGVGLPRWMTSAWLGRQKNASGQQIEPRSGKHLALEQLQAVDLPFDGALNPGQGHGGLDGGQVRPEPFGEASEGRQGALSGTR